MSKLHFFPGLLMSLLLTACTTILSNLPGVYSLEVQQGNIVDQGMVDQLRPNMNKRQVLYIMGSPMLVDVFNQTRWDYIYSDQPDGEDRVQKRISLFFNKDDQLSGIQGDFRPGSQPALKPTGETTVDIPKRDLDSTLWDYLTGLFNFDDKEEAPEKSAAIEKEHAEDNSQDSNAAASQ
jgi:outer membrane protein assembly factor BamE